MKFWAIVMTALTLVLCCAVSFAVGNATIVVEGRGDFNSMINTVATTDKYVYYATMEHDIMRWSSESRQTENMGNVSTMLSDLIQEDEDGDMFIELADGDTLEYDDIEMHMGVNSAMIGGEGMLYGIVDLTNNMQDELKWLLIAYEETAEGLRIASVTMLDDVLAFDFDSGLYSIRLSMAATAGGKLYSQFNDEEGARLASIDPESGELETIDVDLEGTIRAVNNLDDERLILVVDDEDDEGKMISKLYVYQIEDEEAKEICVLTTGMQMATACVYDAVRSKLYHVAGGNCYRMPFDGETAGKATVFADMPLELYGHGFGNVIDDLYVVSSANGIIGRDVNHELSAEQKKLNVQNPTGLPAVQSAYYDFIDAHPEYEVVISAVSNVDSLLQAMMSRSCDVDVYVLDMSGSAYESMFTRRFLAEMDSSEVLRDAISRIYPNLRKMTTIDGKVVAVPMTTYAQDIDINVTLLTETLGYDEADLPTSWEGLFELLADIAEKGEFGQLENARVLDYNTTIGDTKRELFDSMLVSYATWLNADAENLSRAQQVLEKLCAAFEKIDWEALGLTEDDEGLYSFDNVHTLFEVNKISTSNSPAGIFGVQMKPTVMSVEKGGIGYACTQVVVAIVNPFSQHRADAVEYVEYCWKQLDEITRLEMIPDINTPVENRYYESSLKGWENEIAQYQRQIDRSDDDDVRDRAQALIDQMTPVVEWFRENNRYIASPEGISQYRTLMENMIPIYGEVWSSMNSDVVRQYLDGGISGKQLAETLGKTLSMKRREDL